MTTKAKRTMSFRPTASLEKTLKQAQRATRKSRTRLIEECVTRMLAGKNSEDMRKALGVAA